MSSSQNFVPLPFFVNDSAGKEPDKKKNDGFNFGAPSASSAPAETLKPTMPSAAVPQPANAKPESPNNFFSGPSAASSRGPSITQESLEQKGLQQPPWISVKKEDNNNFVEPWKSPVLGTTQPSKEINSIGGNPFDSMQTFQQPSSTPWNPPALESTTKHSPLEQPWNLKAAEAFSFKGAQDSDNRKVEFTPLAPTEVKVDPLPPWAINSQATSAANNESWKSPQQQKEPQPPLAPPSVSWSAPAPPEPSFTVDNRRNSAESQKSNTNFIHSSEIHNANVLETVEETLSIRSFANSSFVLEGGKACIRCGKTNEAMANFCSRCGAQIGSPMESPTSSQICTSSISIDSNTVAIETTQQNNFDPVGENYQYNKIEQQFASLTIQPQSPKKPHESRIYPVISFGLGGSFALTFPSLQTRFNPNGEPLTAYRPSILYKGDLSTFPMTEDSSLKKVFSIDKGNPLIGKNCKDLNSLVSSLRKSFPRYALLYGLFEAMLKEKGNLLGSPKLIEYLKNILPMAQGFDGPHELGELTKRLEIGDRNGAIELAMSRGMWSHALILAQPVGPQVYTQVISGFVQGELPKCHPLRLLFLYESNQLSQFKSELLETQSIPNWASILLLILGCKRSDLDYSGFLVTLGDALEASNDSISSQFCYLLSQSDAAVFERDGLLGSPQVTSYDWIECLRLTEVYEAVRHSIDPTFSLPHLFSQKLAFISLLCDLGLGPLAVSHRHALDISMKNTKWKSENFSSAFPQLSSIMEALTLDNPGIDVSENILDSGSNKVIGMETENHPPSKSPIFQSEVNVETQRPAAQSPNFNNNQFAPPINVPVAVQFSPNPMAAPVESVAAPLTSPPFHERMTPVGGFDPFSRRASIEARMSPVITSTVSPPIIVNEPVLQQSPQINISTWEPPNAMSTAMAPSNFDSPQKPIVTGGMMPYQFSMPNLTAPPQAVPNQQQVTHFEASPIEKSPATASLDDFGLSNNNKAGPLPAVEDIKDKDSDAGSKGSKLGFIWGIFGNRKKDSASPALSAGSAGSGPVKANLGDSEMSLVYDEVQKKWVRKDTGAPPVAEAVAPPPPSMASSTSLSGDNASPISYRRGQTSGARGKYVDALNPTSNSNDCVGPTAPRANLIPTPGFAPFSSSNFSQEPQQPTQSTTSHVSQQQQQSSFQQFPPNNFNNNPASSFQPPFNPYQGFNPQ